MNIDVPYDEMTLKIALISAGSKLDEEGLQEKLLENLAPYSPETPADLNKKIAEHHGISLLDLINSPNFISLKDDYLLHHLALIRKIYKDFGFDDKEAWALMCLSLGQLRDI